MEQTNPNRPEIKVKIDRYEKDVLEYEKAPAKPGKIIFYGSSGFTRWKASYGNRPLEECIIGKDGKPAAINHGIGGSTVEDILYYYPRLVKAWKPRALVITSYINDYACGYSPEEIMFLLARLLADARTDMPGIKLYLTDVRPNAKHNDGYDKEWDDFTRTTNRLLKEYCAAHEDTALIELSKEALYYKNKEDIGNYFKTNDDIFIEDKIHFTPEGYDLFAEAFNRALADIL